MYFIVGLFLVIAVFMPKYFPAFCWICGIFSLIVCCTTFPVVFVLLAAGAVAFVGTAIWHAFEETNQKSRKDKQQTTMEKAKDEVVSFLEDSH